MNKPRRISTEKFHLLVGRQIKTARREAGLTQEQLGRLLKRSKVWLIAVEKGRLGIKAVDLYRVAACTGKKIQWFFPV